MNPNHYFVTTPIYYVNDQPHIGHAYTTLLADVLARYRRLMGVPTWFLTGTDEHGQKVKQAAQLANITPQQQADQTVVRFEQLWKRLEITHNDFIRTTQQRHKTVVQAILKDLYERDEIYRADYDGWYCVTCERFYTEKDLLEGRCPEAGCGRPVDRITETNYFFRMSRYQDWLIEYISQNPKFIQPDFRRNETLGFLKKKLNDLCISRPKSRMDWGIELPFDSNFVTYVWFDALVNYISAVGYKTDPVLFEKWWPASCHLIGKDILTTHTVYWPTMLKAMNLPMPQTVFAHGWWLSGRDKMSKTAGNVVNPMDFVDCFGVDPFRYFLMAEMTLGQDASFTEEAFKRRYNADLANDLGNLLSRVIKIVGTSCAGKIPTPGNPGPDEISLQANTEAAAHAMVAHLGHMRLDLGLAEIANTIREANRYFEKAQPWALAKGGDPERLGTVLFWALETLRIVSGLLYPVMPEKMAELRTCLGIGSSEPLFADLTVWGKLKPGTPIGAMVNLFPRIDTKEHPPIATKAAQTQPEKTTSAAPCSPATPTPDSGLVDIAEFGRLDLRVARVLTAERVEKADKLLKLTIELGTETRQIVAGIAKHYTPEEMVGKNIVVVKNLKPAKIRGIESFGMLLAAKDGEALTLVGPEKPIGSNAKVG